MDSLARTGSSSFECIYQLVNSLSHLCVFSPDESTRYQSSWALQQLVVRLSERARVKLLRLYVTQCPYPATVSLVMGMLRDDLVQVRLLESGWTVFLAP